MPSTLSNPHLQQAEASLVQGRWQEAIAHCRLVPKADHSAAIYKLLGNAFVYGQQWDKAEIAYEEALKLQPNWAEVYANLGTLEAQQQHWVKALQYYRQAITLKPELTDLEQNIEQVWQQIETSPQVIPELQQGFTATSDLLTPGDYLRLGDCLVSQNQVEGAIAVYQRAIELDPQFATAYWNLSVAYEKVGDRGAMLAAYDQALALQPEWATAMDHCKLGNDWLKQEEWERAIGAFERAIGRDESVAEAHFGLGMALQKVGKLEEAIGAYRQVVQCDKNHWQGYHNLGGVLLELQRWDEAVDVLKKAIELKPDYFWAHQNLGDGLMRLAQWEDAVGAYRKAIGLKDDFHWSYFNLGEALTKLKWWNDAVDAYHSATRLQPKMMDAHRKLATTLYQRAQSDLATAFESYQQILQQDPNDTESYHKALEIRKDNVELYVGLADALARKNQLDKAIIFYELALQLQPGDINAKARLDEALNRKKQLTEGLGFKVQSATYALWLRENAPKLSELKYLAIKAKSLEYKPLISIIVPTYNTPEVFLRDMIQSVLNQVYPHWELCIADDASSQLHVKQILEEYSTKDQRIKVIFRRKNGHISAASNSALKLATGEFITLLDHDDLLPPDALYEVASLLNRHPEADMIYSDEDKVNEHQELLDPYFKPDWCPDLLLSQNYICHLGTYRRTLINKIGGFRIGYEGSQDYDLVLRLTEKTNNIFHIPKVLYHWRIHSESAASGGEAKPYAYEAGKKALQDMLRRRGEKGQVTSHHNIPGIYTVRYEISEYKLVSIIIPTRNFGDILDCCLKSIFEKTSYPNYEVIVIDNGSDEIATLKIFDAWKRKEPQRFKVFTLDIPFNYSLLNNYGVSVSKGDYLLFLNNDTEIFTSDWIEAMVEQAQRSSVGAVGALLLYPDNTIQHAGVVLGIQGVAGHGHKNFQISAPGYFSRLLCVSNYAAVTAACMMSRRDVYDQVNGFDETLKVAFNDVDFCLKIREQGYQNILLPHVVLYHYESKSRGLEDTPEKQARFRKEIEIMQNRWANLIANDPCYSPNLTLESDDYSIRIAANVEVLEIKTVQTPNEDIWDVSIDLPTAGAIRSGSLSIAGWVVGRRAEIIAIEMLCNCQIIHFTPINTTRPDVGKMFSHVPGAEKSGFTTIINVTELPTESELSLRAVFIDNCYSTIGSIKLRY